MQLEIRLKKTVGIEVFHDGQAPPRAFKELGPGEAHGGCPVRGAWKVNPEFEIAFGMRVLDRRDRLATGRYGGLLLLGNNRLRYSERRAGRDNSGCKYHRSDRLFDHVLSPLRRINKTVLVRRMYVNKQLIIWR